MQREFLTPCLQMMGYFRKPQIPREFLTKCPQTNFDKPWILRVQFAVRSRWLWHKPGFRGYVLVLMMMFTLCQKQKQPHDIKPSFGSLQWGITQLGCYEVH